MITKDNFAELLKYLEFSEKQNVFKKEYQNGASIEVNFNTKEISYAPLDVTFKEGDYPSKDKPSKGFVIHRKTTLNFNAKENFVCLVCVHLLLKKGYEPKHIVIEPAFKLAHGVKPSYGDVLVFDKEFNPLVLIENKTYGSEFSKEWNNMLKDGGQLFGYLGEIVKTMKICQNLVLFAADFEENRIVPKIHIITLKDNEKRIAELDNPQTFANTQGKYFEVWKDTYRNAIETKGLFEDDVEPYSIGKLKYTINDIEGLSHAEIRPIYHEFATILRNHAITDFEHSFYILVDLFLCKITDERNNPDDLQFRYKGITRDTPKEYCARLLDLYQQGKKQLFGVDVINKNESDISQIFEEKQRTKNGLYEGIKELFEEIKFYNIKKFNFIDVENKEDFELNFQILIEVTSLLQDIRLSDSETNHFFGDLFEGLLSKNVHQTEGQFFTPLPIVNFIIKSLPEFPNNGSVKVLDYACGAGHFLTEFLKAYPKVNAYGIEKSQPLSQVAKIATIINGAQDSHIVFKDALSIFNTQEVRFQGFDKESFDCLIANPPYSVDGFLSTMTEKDRKCYSLTEFVDEKSYITNDNIQCFFIERATHFLKKNGLMAIVLPVSILSNNDNIFKKTRELIYANFNILSIVGLNSRTFGSTGTNTIILFAQKVTKNSKGLLDSFINKSEYKSYTNHEAIDAYIEKQGYNREEFFTLMQDSILGETLKTSEIFVEYRRKFKPKDISKTLQKQWFKDSLMYNADKKDNSKENKELLNKYLVSEEYKEHVRIEHYNQFVSFVKSVEYDKLNTFIQIHDNYVAILQSPPDKIGNKSNKENVIKFLGYDWSSRRNDEGIKYITNKPIEELDEEEIKNNDKDLEILEAINSIKFIETPLYNPNDAWDNSKYAFAIRKHLYTYCNKSLLGDNLPECVMERYNGETDSLLAYQKLSDLIKFDRGDFNKSFTLNTNKKIEIISKYPLKRLGGSDGLCDIKIGGTPSRKNRAYFTGSHLWVSIAEMNGQIITDTKEKITDAGIRDSNVKLIPKGTTLLSFKLSIGKTAIAGKDLYTNEAIAGLIPKDINVITNEYLFAIFNAHIIDLGDEGDKAFGKSLNSTYLNEEVKIPLPPINIQRKIVDECKKIDEEYNSSRMSIEDYRKKIAEVFERLDIISKSGGVIYRLTDKEKFEISIGKRVLNKEVNPAYDIPVYSANVFEPFGMINRELITDFSRDSVIWGIDGDWMVNVIPANNPFYPTDHCGVMRIKTDNILPKYMAHLLEVAGQEVGFKRSYRASIDRIESLSVNVAPIEEQRKAISEIKIYEQKIAEAKAIMQSCENRKRYILDKYLK